MIVNNHIQNNTTGYCECNENQRSLITFCCIAWFSIIHSVQFVYGMRYRNLVFNGISLQIGTNSCLCVDISNIVHFWLNKIKVKRWMHLHSCFRKTNWLQIKFKFQNPSIIGNWTYLFTLMQSFNWIFPYSFWQNNC